MRKIQIAISSYLCIRLTWNLTGSCGQQQRLRGWSHMVVKRFQDGGRPLFWKSLYRHISAKSSDFHEILYTAADFELDERHVALVSNKKKLHWTDSEFDRTYFLFYFIHFVYFHFFVAQGVLLSANRNIVYSTVSKLSKSGTRLWRQLFTFDLHLVPTCLQF